MDNKLSEVSSSRETIDEAKLADLLLDEATVRPVIAQLAQDAKRQERIDILTAKDIYCRLAEHFKISPLHITTNAPVKSFIKSLSKTIVLETVNEPSVVPAPSRKRQRTSKDEVKVPKRKKAAVSPSPSPAATRRQRAESPKAAARLTKIVQALGKGPGFYKGLPPKSEPEERAKELKQRVLQFAAEHNIPSGRGKRLPTLQEAKDWKEEMDTKEELASLGLHEARDGRIDKTRGRQRRVINWAQKEQDSDQSGSSSSSSSSSGEDDKSNEGQSAESEPEKSGGEKKAGGSDSSSSPTSSVYPSDESDDSSD